MSALETTRKSDSGNTTSTQFELIKRLRLGMQEFLSRYRSANVLLYLPPGNAGDALIATGIFQAFARADIKFKIIGLADDVCGQTVFLGGGGNLVPFYSDIREAYSAFIGKAKEIILLPHTIRGHEETIKLLDHTCIVFCRDHQTFDHIRLINPKVDNRMAHDMAFHIDLEELFADSNATLTKKRWLRRRLFSTGFSEAKMRSMYGIDMLRLDRESTTKSRDSDMDISDLFTLGVTPDAVGTSAWCFLNAISFAKNINTDRLHVGIGAALLGTSCVLQDNSYGKNSAVYDYSLREFENIKYSNRQGRRFDYRAASLWVKIGHWLPIKTKRGVSRVLSRLRSIFRPLSALVS